MIGRRWDAASSALLARGLYVRTRVDDRRDRNKSKGCGPYRQLDRVTGPARPWLSAGSGDHQDDAARLDHDRCHRDAVYLRTVSGATVTGGDGSALECSTARQGKKQDGNCERSEMSLEAQMVKVDGEIVVISCEQCGNTYEILMAHSHADILSTCRCGKCQYPLFSAEEIGANQFEGS